jgi:hypothetical protein
MTTCYAETTNKSKKLSQAREDPGKIYTLNWLVDKYYNIFLNCIIVQNFYYIPDETRPTPPAPPGTPATSRPRAAAPRLQQGFTPTPQPYDEETEEDNEWTKDLPLTGHVETDKEIVKYFKSRRNFINTQSQSPTKLSKGT